MQAECGASWLNIQFIFGLSLRFAPFGHAPVTSSTPRHRTVLIRNGIPDCARTMRIENLFRSKIEIELMCFGCERNGTNCVRFHCYTNASGDLKIKSRKIEMKKNLISVRKIQCNTFLVLGWCRKPQPNRQFIPFSVWFVHHCTRLAERRPSDYTENLPVFLLHFANQFILAERAYRNEIESRRNGKAEILAKWVNVLCVCTLYLHRFPIKIYALRT